MEVSSSLKLRVALVASVILGLFAVLAISQVERSEAGVNSWTRCGKADPFRTYAVKNRVGCKKAKGIVNGYSMKGKVPKGWFVKVFDRTERPGLKYTIIHPKRPAEIAVRKFR